MEAFRCRSHEVKGNPAHPVSSSTNFRPVVHSPPAHSEFALNSIPPASRISEEQYLILMREIGRKEAEYRRHRLLYSSRSRLPGNDLEPVSFDRCVEGLVELSAPMLPCRAC